MCWVLNGMLLALPKVSSSPPINVRNGNFYHHHDIFHPCSFLFGVNFCNLVIFFSYNEKKPQEIVIFRLFFCHLLK
jgi:hypothetical protein